MSLNPHETWPEVIDPINIHWNISIRNFLCFSAVESPHFPMEQSEPPPKGLSEPYLSQRWPHLLNIHIFSRLNCEQHLSHHFNVHQHLFPGSFRLLFWHFDRSKVHRRHHSLITHRCEITHQPFYIKLCRRCDCNLPKCK